VYEVDQESNVIRIKSLGKPEPPPKKVKAESTTVASTTDSAIATPQDETVAEAVEAEEHEEDIIVTVEAATPSDTAAPEDSAIAPDSNPNAATEIKNESSSTNAPTTTTSAPNQPASKNDKDNVWQDHFDIELKAFLSDDAIVHLKEMYLQGRDPPRVSDNGWASRKVKSEEAETPEPPEEPQANDKKGKGRDRRGGRGGKGGRGGGRVGRNEPEDSRKVVSDVRIIFLLLCSKMTFLCFQTPSDIFWMQVAYRVQGDTNSLSY
jgi:tRNA pseudouridine13 synthase